MKKITIVQLGFDHLSWHLISTFIRSYRLSHKVDSDNTRDKIAHIDVVSGQPVFCCCYAGHLVSVGDRCYFLFQLANYDHIIPGGNAV